MQQLIAPWSGEGCDDQPATNHVIGGVSVEFLWKFHGLASVGFFITNNPLNRLYKLHIKSLED